MLGLLDPLLIVYLILFFLVGYLFFASVFAAVGAAVNEMREAQSLMTPIMLALMAPWFFAAPIGRDPNSTFSVAMSMIPPVNTFAMMIRLASTTPPPFWQVGLSLVIGLVSGLCRHLVRREDLQGRAAHARQAAKHGHADPLGAPGMIWVGTSGYNYPEWKGSFYPEKLPAAKMLPYYAERFPTVEINYTFYRTPNEKILDGWNQATPERYKLTLKAPKRITHDRRLRDCADPVRQFFETAATLGPKLGALLFQLAPNFKKDLPLFDTFLDAFPPRVCAAFEFRHTSWLDEEVYARLRARNLALCIADSEKLSTPIEITADYAYFRLRDEGYQEADIAKWADVIREKTSGCQEVFVYFKHEESGKGPEFAKALITNLGL